MLRTSITAVWFKLSRWSECACPCLDALLGNSGRTSVDRRTCAAWTVSYWACLWVFCPLVAGSGDKKHFQIYISVLLLRVANSQGGGEGLGWLGVGGRGAPPWRSCAAGIKGSLPLTPPPARGSPSRFLGNHVGVLLASAPSHSSETTKPSERFTRLLLWVMSPRFSADSDLGKMAPMT